MAELKVEDIKRMSDDEMDAEVLKLKNCASGPRTS